MPIDPISGLMKILSGQGPDELGNAARTSKFADLPGGPDKATHALATSKMTKRIGAGPALGVGLAREVVSGGLNKLKGGNFFDKAGFDPADMKANFAGARDASPFVDNAANIIEGLSSGAQSLAKAVQSQPEQPKANEEEEREAEKDSTIARKATDPISRQRALFNSLNKPNEIEGSMGGINGVLASLGGK